MPFLTHANSKHIASSLQPRPELSRMRMHATSNTCMRATNTSHAHACMYLCRCQATAAWQCSDQPICLSIDADIESMDNYGWGSCVLPHSLQLKLASLCMKAVPRQPEGTTKVCMHCLIYQYCVHVLSSHTPATTPWLLTSCVVPRSSSHTHTHTQTICRSCHAMLADSQRVLRHGE